MGNEIYHVTGLWPEMGKQCVLLKFILSFLYFLFFQIISHWM